jgi:hypothetical protein
MADSRKSISSRFSSWFESTGLLKDVDTGIVIHVILNEDDENILESSKSEENPKLVSAYIGHAKIRNLQDPSPNEKDLLFYAPFNPDEGTPLVGETVQLFELGATLFYKRIPSPDINLGNAKENKDLSLNTDTDKSDGNSSNYSETSQTGTPNSSAGGDRDKKIGGYFEPERIHQLRLYEGDKILQSRFGQSIRFSGYNNEDNEFSPTIIIRNRENDESVNDLFKNDITEEDVNKDGSIIAITSDKFKIPFQPGLIDDGGSSNFETIPINFELPEEYVGYDQMLLNSERIIISAKSQEMIFFSKGNYGFISDGELFIENGNAGAQMDFGGDVTIKADRNSNNVWINTGNGQIRLNTDDSGNSPGTRQKEPLARGETLVKLLSELIDAITQQVFATPAGPTATGPLNVASFKKIQGQLDKIKSTLNFTE